MQDAIIDIAEKIARGGKNIFFTGAGISTESGIPDYRSQGGLWDRFQPVYFSDFMASREARIEYWRQRIDMGRSLETAQPNQGHMALHKLHELGLLEAVITQNIDGLHQMSGLPESKIVELHGNTTRIRCMTCGEISSAARARERIENGDPAPECRCGGYLKPDTISFGQSMPVKEMQKASALSRKCDLFCVVGSTLVVHPAAQMPHMARDHGAFLGIINLSETPCDSMCDALIREKAGRALMQIVGLVERRIDTLPKE